MVLIDNLGVNINVCYSGLDVDECKRFISFVISRNGLKKKNGPDWLLPISYKEELQQQFNTKEIVHEWDDIGADMKLSPYPYQKEAIHYALNNPRSLLLLPVGSGKTLIAVGLMMEYKATDPIIVCTKTSLKYQWIKEIEKFSDLKANIINTPSKAKKKFDEQFIGYDVYILNYETLKNEEVCEKLREHNVCGIIQDEQQCINNPKAERSKASYQFNDLPLIIGTTATPITNNPLNLFGIFNMIEPSIFESYSKFSNRYIIWKYRQPVKAKNVPEMLDKVRPYIFRKSEEDIASQMPELNILPVITCTMTKNMEEANAIFCEKLKELNTTIDKLDKQGVPETDARWIKAQANLQAYQTYSQELADDISLLESSNLLLKDINIYDTTNPKLNELLEIIEQLLSAEEKICIFTRYERMQHIIIDAIRKKFNKECALVNGSMNPEERYHQAIEEFDLGDKEIIVATDAMNAGISLPHCKYLIEYEPALSFADQTQRRGRIRRANSVSRISYIYRLVTESSWDEIQLKSINKKKGYDDSLQDL